VPEVSRHVLLERGTGPTPVKSILLKPRPTQAFTSVTNAGAMPQILNKFALI